MSEIFEFDDLGLLLLHEHWFEELTRENDALIRWLCEALWETPPWPT
jgi:hypothetical protein